VRKIIDRAQPDLNAAFDEVDGQPRTFADAVIAPTRIYVKPILQLMSELPIKGMAHITGGGLTENVPRVLPENTVAMLDKASWQRPKLFDWLQANGNVDDAEMHRVFNCGIGMVVIVAAEHAATAAKRLAELGETVFTIGKIEARAEGQHQTIVK
jgi:phosphoribosylformylglycinamidine cyclo-ligase